MDIKDYLRPESVLIGLEKGTKTEIIRRLVDLLPLENGAGDAEGVLRDVLERESVMTTGIGRGVAIPHARTNHVKGLMAAIAVAPKPLPFDAIDGKPVRIFFLLVSAPGAGNPHIQALSHISRLLNDERHKEALGSATSVEEVYAALEMPE
jgi:mannitol/fructose-specific phosphotransferase system IIA component (Ntr-type)